MFTTITRKTLLDLKELALKANPFIDANGRIVPYEDLSQECQDRIKSNADFFLAIHPVLPSLIDELIYWRSNYG